MTTNDQEPADWRDLIDQLTAEQIHLLENMENDLGYRKSDAVLLDLARRKAIWNIAAAVHFVHLDPPVGDRSLESEDGGDQVMSTGWLTDMGQTEEGDWFREFTCDRRDVDEGCDVTLMVTQYDNGYISRHVVVNQRWFFETEEVQSQILTADRARRLAAVLAEAADDLDLASGSERLGH